MGLVGRRPTRARHDEVERRRHAALGVLARCPIDVTEELLEKDAERESSIRRVAACSERRSYKVVESDFDSVTVPYCPAALWPTALRSLEDAKSAVEQVVDRLGAPWLMARN